MSSADEYNKRVLDLQLVTPSDLSVLTTSYQNSVPGVAIDGKLGPKTRALLSDQKKQVEQLTITGGFNMFDGPLSHVPTNRAEVYDIFGNPGATKVDRSWRRKNIKRLTIPGVTGSLWLHKQPQFAALPTASSPRPNPRCR